MGIAGGGIGSVRSLAVFALLRWSAMQLLWLALAPIAASAAPVPVDSRVCHGTSPVDVADAAADTIAFTCGGTPAAYQGASLWLRLQPQSYLPAGQAATLLVHQTRFDRLAVGFRYTDGRIEWQRVRKGAFGDHWRPGAQIAFTPNDRSASVTTILVRIDNLASAQLLRLRIVDDGEADLETGILAALIGAALTLLLAGALYNLSLAIGIRRQYLAWQGVWAIAVFAWGIIWSQFSLLVVPGIAGTLAAQTCTALSTLSMLLATMSIFTAIGPSKAPAVLRWTMVVLGAAVAVLGVPGTLAKGPLIDLLIPVLAITALGNLLSAVLCMAWGMRRGSAEARDLLAAWSVPMAAVALTQFVDIGSRLWGGGAQILVLFASAWQTIWLSIAASRRLARLRAERDLARAAEARASRLAERDPLTGIRNRRGFVDAAGALIAAADRDDATLALLLIDIDRFKTINDEHGHDAGDAVLCTIATRLTRWEGPMCVAARLGGEEFALLVAHLCGPALTSFADHVRHELAACDHSEVIGARSITASIGVTEAKGRCDFAQLYREADRALYVAKRTGRNRICRADRAAEPVEASAPVPAANQRVG